MADETALPTAEEFLGGAKDAALPTAEEFFSRPAPAPEGVFVPAAGHDFWSQTSAGRVLTQFGYGAGGDEGMQFKPGLTDDQIKVARSAGWFNDYEKGQRNIGKALLESTARPAAAAFDTFIRTLSGGFRAVQQTGEEAGAVLGRTTRIPGAEQAGRSMGRELVGGGLEAFQAGKYTGLPSRIHPPDLKAARDLKVIGATDAEWRGTVEAKEAEPVIRDSEIERVFRDAPSEIERVFRDAPAETPVVEAPGSVQSVARGIAPDLFANYDAVQARRDRLSADARELGEMRATTIDQAREIADLRAKVAEQLREAEVQSREMAPAVREAYVEAAKAAPEEIPPQTPETAPAPAQAIPNIEAQRAFIAGDVRQKMIDAGRPAAEADAAAAIEAAYWTTRAERFQGKKGTAEEMYRLEAPEILGPSMQSDYRTPRKKPTYERISLLQFIAGRGGIIDNDPLISDVRTVLGTKNKLIPGFGTLIQKKGRRLDEMREAAAEAGYLPWDTTPGQLIDLIDTEMRGQKVHRRGEETGIEFNRDDHLIAIERALDEGLQEVGIDPKYVPDEVRARAIELMDKGESDPVMAYEKAEAEQGMFQRDRLPMDQASRRYAAFDTEKVGSDRLLDQGGDIVRGRIRLREDGRNTITLLKDANASTFIHEKGHDYLHRLLRDAADAQAPDILKADAETALKWLGVEKAADVKTRHHEKFARGFENYIMEGRAPSHALARVFEQFRQWLLRIYTEASRLKAPINDEIRGVFDRMFELDPKEVVIAPDRAPEAMAGRHEVRADVTPPVAADAAAVAVRGERDTMADRLPPEGQDARLAEIRAGLEGRPRGDTDLAGGGPAAQPPAAGGGLGAEPGTVGEGGGQAPPQGRPAPERAAADVAVPDNPHATLPRPETPLVDKAGNIRLDNLNTPEDVNAVLRQAADENEGFITDRRGVLSDSEVEGLASALGMDAKALDRRKIGEAFNAEQIVAARKLLVQSAVAVRDAAAAAAKGDEAAIMAYAEARTRLLMVEKHVAGITAEAGRALRAFRAIQGMDDAKGTTDFIKAQALKDATGKTLFQLQREAQLAMQLDTPSKVAKFVNDVDKPTWKDKVIEAWINALLSGPMTHATNLIGNTITSLYSIPETAVAGAIGTAMRLAGREQGVFVGEAGARLFSLVQGSKDGVRAAWEILKNEDAIVNERTQVEQRKPRAIGGTTGKVVRAPSRLLAAEDAVFRAKAFREEIAAQAYRQAAKEGLDGTAFNARVAELMQNPTEAMVKAGDLHSSYQTYQKQLGQTAQFLSMMANSNIGVKVVVPFVKTPTNLLKYAGERSPLAFFSQEVRNNLMGRNGAAARDTQAARIAMGSAISIWAVSQALEGNITGGGPTNADDRALWMATGRRPYSVKIGNHYYSYASLEPFSTLLGVAADMAEVAKVSSADENENIGKLLMASVIKNLTDKTSLRGPSELAKIIDDPDRGSDKWIQRLVGSAIPAGVAQVAQAGDPYVREARTIIDGIKARTPGFSQDLMPKRDRWGEPIERTSGIGPTRIYVSRIKDDPVNQALERLGISPPALKRNIKGVELTDQQYDDYARIAGRTAKLRLDAMVSQPWFASAPAFVQTKMMTSAVDGARQEAQALVQMQYPEIIQAAIEAKREILTAK